MTKMTSSILSDNINTIDVQIQSTTQRLFKLACDDIGWWKSNIISLTALPFTTLKNHLQNTNDNSLDQWSFIDTNLHKEFDLNIIESIIWLTSLCNLDKYLIIRLPQEFVDYITLYWRLYAYNYFIEQKTN